jgi:hypothetical protein
LDLGLGWVCCFFEALLLFVIRAKIAFFFFFLFFFTPQPPPQCLPVSAASPTVRISPLRRAVVLTLAATRAGYSYTGASEHQFCDFDIENGFQFSKP